MEIKVLHETGFEQAVAGLSLSFMEESAAAFEMPSEERLAALKKLSKTQSEKDGGHNKFLESMQVWVMVKAPRGWWQEFDTYRVGVTKQSASTMHTIQRRPLKMNDFEKGTDAVIVDRFNQILAEETENFTTKTRLSGDALQRVKWNIPEGFLQTRIVCLNYKALRNIFVQRHDHRLPQWQLFISQMRAQLKYTDCLPVDSAKELLEIGDTTIFTPNALYQKSGPFGLF